MIKIEELKHLFGAMVTVLCVDGEVIVGRWSEWFSKDDNSWAEEEGIPNEESVLIDTADGVPMEIRISEIISIQ